MRFDKPLIAGRLIRRYKRFLADVELTDGRLVTAHTPNTGSMMGCADPGSRIWLRDTGSSTRKYPLSWELVESENGTLVGINTGLANQLVVEAIATGVIPQLQGYQVMRREVPYGRERSRIDLLLQGEHLPDCFVEVKNVTLKDSTGCARFPDAVTDRGARHLRELQACVHEGHRAVMVYCVQRGDVTAFGPADAIDPEYGRTLRAAVAHGVGLIACQAIPTVRAIVVERSLPIRWD